MFMLLGLISSQTVKQIVLSDSGEKTQDEISANLRCLSHSKWNLFFENNLPNLGIQYIRDQLSMGASENKKYYIRVNDTHNLVYFKEGHNYFINLIYSLNDGTETLLMRAFLQENFNNCIQLLPESCKWKGERIIKYIEVCEKGLVKSGEFTHDFFDLILDEDQGVFSPLEIAKAIRDCYQPNVYSIAYKCYVDGLYFDPQGAVKYLKEVQSKIEDHGFETYLDLDTMEIKYSKISVNAKNDPFYLE